MPEGIPVQKVVQYKSQGMTNDKIINALSGENYSYQQIRDAIQQANIKQNVGTPGVPVQQQQGSAPTPQPAQTQQAQPAPSTAQIPQSQTPPKRMANVDLDEIQRVLEEIIQEKWRESEKVINELHEWRAVVNTKLKEFDTRISEFNSRVDALNTVLGQKAEAFNETMQNVDTEIKALEKALGRLVPTLSDNISELKSLVGNIKQKE